MVMAAMAMAMSMRMPVAIGLRVRAVVMLFFVRMLCMGMMLMVIGHETLSYWNSRCLRFFCSGEKTSRLRCMAAFPEFQCGPVTVHCVVIGIENARVAASVAAIVEIRLYRRYRTRIVKVGHG
jgi:hypothetical protein